MPLSSNTLIHFTSTKDSLKGILENNFQVHYCNETLILGGKKETFAVPMVSFCDIPLSEVKDHIKKYGSYGIGMTKAWGLKMGLNPVLYIACNSSLSKSYRTAFRHFATGRVSDLRKMDENEKSLADLVRYMKNYEADLDRSGSITKDYRYSDEREWRFVPDFSEPCEMFVFDNSNRIEKAKYDLSLESMRVRFEPNDIKYIIIANDSEIGEFVTHLRQAKGKLYSHDDLERLTTRILTTDQIMTDI